MEKTAVPYLLGILLCSILPVAAYAFGCWRAGSRATRKTKSQAEPSTPISDAHYASLRAEMAELYATLEKLTTTVKRISSRHGMQDKRERDQDVVESPEADQWKRAVLRKAGLLGKVGPEFARRQQQLEIEKH